MSLTEYPDTCHAFDTPTLPETYLVSKARSTRDSRLKKGPAGTIVNTLTRFQYSTKSDPCVATGAHVGYNPDAARAAREAITVFVKQVLANCLRASRGHKDPPDNRRRSPLMASATLLRKCIPIYPLLWSLKSSGRRSADAGPGTALQRRERRRRLRWAS
jgi:hypothetical protein